MCFPSFLGSPFFVGSAVFSLDMSSLSAVVFSHFFCTQGGWGNQGIDSRHVSFFCFFSCLCIIAGIIYYPPRLVVDWSIDGPVDYLVSRSVD